MKQGAVDALTQKAPSSEAIQRATKTGSAKVRFLVADENNWEALLDASAPAPMAPEALDESDTDALLLALTQRCQQGFD